VICDFFQTLAISSIGSDGFDIVFFFYHNGEQYYCYPEQNPNQRFTFTHIADGMFRMVSVNPGKAIAVAPTASPKDAYIPIMQHVFFGMQIEESATL
jgi:hypothetical protein